MQFENFKVDIDADGIAVITWDMPGRSMNVISQAVSNELQRIVEMIATDANIKGAVLTSGKNAFCAGADLNTLGDMAPQDETAAAKAAFDNSMASHARQRKLETCGKPVVAAINGTALGGGLEITLCCHRRIAADNPRAQLGLPESKVGVMPGGGGTQRLPRLIGAQAALPLMLQGTALDPKGALAAGIVHEVVPPTELIAAAKRWIKSGPEPVQPWDSPKFRIPGGGPYSDGGNQVFNVANALVHKETYGNFTNAHFILRAVYEGLMVPIDAGLRIEARYFIKLLAQPSTKSMIRSLFLSMQELGKGARRPKAVPPSEVKTLGVLGAGMMGAGIAYVSAVAGMNVVLIDVSAEAAEKGKAHARALLDKQVERGRRKPEERDEILARIKPTADFGALSAADFVIEAVFEDRAVKEETIRKAEAALPAAAIFGSNTSTLPITSLAQASARPKSFIGVHFFSPVDRMQLVELIVGKKTSAEAIARALDYVRQIRKTPIVVNDSRGFYTSRCVSTYMDEGQLMLAEGIAPAIIDNVGRASGMPRGPLELSDDVALDLVYKVREQTKKDLGDKYKPSEADRIVETLVAKLGRYGRKNNKGFYEYLEGGKKRLWPGLKDIVKPTIREAEPPLAAELKKRLLYRQALEAARCVEENVVTDPRDADVGAILGWGFAPYTGGPLSLIDNMGAKAFVDECAKLARKYGERFRPNKLLREMAAKNETFYGRMKPQMAAAAE